MHTTIGIYDDRDSALNAAVQLKEAGFPIKKLSVMGLAYTEVIDDKLHVTEKSPINTGSVGTGLALGTAVGVLTGVGIFASPGLGFLFGAGALVGAIAGFDIGLIGGGIASVLTSVGINDRNAHRYNELLKEGKYLVVASGSKEEVGRAYHLLSGNGSTGEVELHRNDDEHNHHSLFSRLLHSIHHLDSEFPLSGGESPHH